MQVGSPSPHTDHVQLLELVTSLAPEQLSQVMNAEQVSFLRHCCSAQVVGLSTTEMQVMSSRYAVLLLLSLVQLTQVQFVFNRQSKQVVKFTHSVTFSLLSVIRESSENNQNKNIHINH